MDQFLVKRMDAAATLPERKSKEAAGYDICSIQDLTIEPGSQALVGTGLAMRCPLGTYARVAPRSGLAVKGIHVGAGVIDRDYRGEVKVLLINLGSTPFVIKQGDRIAQVILEQCVMVDPICVESLDDTHRGDGGFGSTGIVS